MESNAAQLTSPRIRTEISATDIKLLNPSGKPGIFIQVCKEEQQSQQCVFDLKKIYLEIKAEGSGDGVQMRDITLTITSSWLSVEGKTLG